MKSTEQGSEVINSAAPASSETPKEKKDRLRRARIIAVDLQDEVRDGIHAECRASMPKDKTTRREDVYMRYAEIVLVRVLADPSIRPLEFAWGNNDSAKSLRELVATAVTNMAGHLTDLHFSQGR